MFRLKLLQLFQTMHVSEEIDIIGSDMHVSLEIVAIGSDYAHFSCNTRSWLKLIAVYCSGACFLSDSKIESCKVTF